MVVRLVVETHATTEDNEAGIATGWLPGRLAAAGRAQAVELGRRRRDVDVVLCSDLDRAVQTARLAFGAGGPPVLLDWRLRECNYGLLNGAARAHVLGPALAYLTERYPQGESWREAIDRVGAVLPDICRRWPDRTVLVIGHQATRWALAHLIDGVPLERLLLDPPAWQPGWTYVLP